MLYISICKHVTLLYLVKAEKIDDIPHSWAQSNYYFIPFWLQWLEIFGCIYGRDKAIIGVCLEQVHYSPYVILLKTYT